MSSSDEAARDSYNMFMRLMEKSITILFKESEVLWDHTRQRMAEIAANADPFGYASKMVDTGIEAVRSELVKARELKMITDDVFNNSIANMKNMANFNDLASAASNITALKGMYTTVADAIKQDRGDVLKGIDKTIGEYAKIPDLMKNHLPLGNLDLKIADAKIRKSIKSLGVVNEVAKTLDRAAHVIGLER